jgi:stearoyl-CoA desaturase (delta-9 desaturase)
MHILSLFSVFAFSFATILDLDLLLPMQTIKENPQKRDKTKPEMINEPVLEMQPNDSLTNHEGTTMTKLKIVNLIAIATPFVGFLVAAIFFWGTLFNGVQLAIFGLMYFITTIGVTIGYHRLFTHSSFKTSRCMTGILAAFGSMAVEGPVLQWVADHRRHHQCSDEDGDPHSPHLHGDGVLETLRGMWHAHVGWMLSPRPKKSMRYVGDLRKDKLVRKMSKLFPLWVLVGLALPSLLGGLITMTWMGAFLGFLWGGLVRICFVHHVTWSINSVCHIWGAQPFSTNDHSKNNPIMGIFAMGEGWHNNHHAFQSSARHGLRWWQIDVSYLIIWTMSKVGLVYDVRVPSKERIQAKLKS